MPTQDKHGRARLSVPHSRRSIATAGDNARSVRAVRYARKRTGVAFELEQQRARARVPDLRRPVVAAGDDAAPSGLNDALVTKRSWHLISSTAEPVRASQTSAVPSPPPVTIREPSGLNDALLTLLVCPLSSSMADPVCASQTFTVSSTLAVTMRRAVGAERRARALRPGAH